MSSTKPEMKSIKSIFSNDLYRIPRYQRNYAWGKDEIEALIFDIEKARREYEGKDNSYYVGTLIVDKVNDVYETIDGQQRLTTFFIMLCILKNDKNFKSIQNQFIKREYKLNLVYESRNKSTKILNDIYEKSLKKEKKEDYDFGIYNGYTYMLNALKDHIETENLEKFCNFLLNNVHILRIEVPEYTDLNHYFEIMNTRGEQLESHEYIKAYLMKQLPRTEQNKFKSIWEKCSDMEKYIQLSFNDLKTRRKIFGNSWKIFKAYDYDSIEIGIDTDDQTQSISEIINKTPNDYYLEADAEENETEDDKNNKEQKPFSSIINFSNFLLIVLKIQVNNDISFKGSKNTSLVDKDLIDTFKKDEYFEHHPSKVKQFAYNLLKCRYLLDNYVIRRWNTNDQWSLMRIVNNNADVNEEEKDEINKYKFNNTFSTVDMDSEENIDQKDFYTEKIRMILSMFHVSYPAQIRKNWLNAVLDYLFNIYTCNMRETYNISGNDYLEFLEKLARRLFINQYLRNEKSNDYGELYYLIYPECGEVIENMDFVKNISYTEENTDLYWSNLDQGTGVKRFVFNYLDYLIWKKCKEGDARFTEIIKTNHLKQFKYTQRASIEHYYAQDKKGGVRIDETLMNSFGNLALITASENSSNSNGIPAQKYQEYMKKLAVKDYVIPSLKYHMMNILSGPDGNFEKSDVIESHGNMMRDLFVEAIEKYNLGKGNL